MVVGFPQQTSTQKPFPKNMFNKRLMHFHRTAKESGNTKQGSRSTTNCSQGLALWPGGHPRALPGGDARSLQAMFARQGCKSSQSGDHARSLQAVVAREAGRNTLARRPCEEVAGRVYPTGRQARLLARQAGSLRNPPPHFNRYFPYEP